MKKWMAIACLFVITGAKAQEFELGKVSKEELEQKTHPLEPDAVAAVLFEKGTTYMEYSDARGFTLVTETDVRIKIYKKDGYDFANETVRYYIGQNPSEKVTFSKAVTYNLVNGAIEKTKLKSEGEFDEKIDKYWAKKKITMPNVKEGSVIEYRSTIYSPYITSVPTWYFQRSIPVNYSKYVTRFPEYYIFKTNFRGFVLPVRTTSLERKSQVLLGGDRLEYIEAISTYVGEKLPSMKDEAYVNNIRNYISSVEHELSVINMPRKPVQSFSTTWDDVVKTIYDSDSFGAELKKNGYFEDDITALIANIPDNAQRTAAIFNFVKNRMNWNEYNGYSCDAGVRKAYKDKVGNAAEINLMLIAMLRYAGIDANPVLVSTRSNGISFFPNRTAYNYVVCGIETLNNVTFLDATDKHSLPNILPVRALNWNGRLIRANGSSAEVDLMPHFNSKDIVNVISSIDADGKISGKLRDQYFDYNAFLYRARYSNTSKDSYLEKLEKRLEGIEIGEFSSTVDDFSKPVIENYSFTHNSVSEIIGDKIYFPPLLFFTQKENPFKQEKREYPVDFVFPNQDKYTITIAIPEGYAVESMPAPAAVTMGEMGKFSFNISSTGKQIQVAVSVDINEAIVSSNDYQTLKDFYKAIVDKENERIILKKI